jgi:hypothetical protein
MQSNKTFSGDHQCKFQHGDDSALVFLISVYFFNEKCFTRHAKLRRQEWGKDLFRTSYTAALRAMHSSNHVHFTRGVNENLSSCITNHAIFFWVG